MSLIIPAKTEVLENTESQGTHKEHKSFAFLEVNFQQVERI